MIICCNELKKARNSYPDAIKRLREYLEEEEPELAEEFNTLWEKQQKEFNHSNIAEMIETGKFDFSISEKWLADYLWFARKKIVPKWERAFQKAAEEMESKDFYFKFDRHSEQLQKWMEKHSAQMIVEITGTQRQGISEIIQQAMNTNSSPDVLARAIRPMIGLHHGQIKANWNYYQSVKNHLLTENSHMTDAAATEKAEKLARKYAEKQRRQRAMNIARTELASAYNMGEYFSVKQAQEQGYLGHMVKVVVTAGDRRVCRMCQDKEGMEIEMDDMFPVVGKRKMVLVPPFHSCCRCVVLYVEKGNIDGLF